MARKIALASSQAPTIEHPFLKVRWNQRIAKGAGGKGHVKKRQKSSKSVKKFFDTFRQFSRRAKIVKNRQKVSKSFPTLFDNFYAAPLCRPLLGGSDGSTQAGLTIASASLWPGQYAASRESIKVRGEPVPCLMSFTSVGREVIEILVTYTPFANSYLPITYFSELIS